MTLLATDAEIGADMVLTMDFAVIRKPALSRVHPKGPSAWQMSWLFERLHQADIVAARTVLAREDSMDYRRIADTRKDTEAWLQSDPRVPYINYALYQNPLKIRRIVAGIMATAAIAGAVQYTFHQTALAIEGAEEVVHAVDQLREAIEEFGRDDPDDEAAKGALEGQGSDPEIKVTRIEAQRDR
jgi:hypothetical protein